VDTWQQEMKNCYHFLFVKFHKVGMAHMARREAGPSTRYSVTSRSIVVTQFLKEEMHLPMICADLNWIARWCQNYHQKWQNF